MSESVAESKIVEAELSWLSDLAHAIEHGVQLAPGESNAERDAYREIPRAGRSCEAIKETLRPTPLPKLTSGELRVRAGETVVKEAV